MEKTQKPKVVFLKQYPGMKIRVVLCFRTMDCVGNKQSYSKGDPYYVIEEYKDNNALGEEIWSTPRLPENISVNDIFKDCITYLLSKLTRKNLDNVKFHPTQKLMTVNEVRKKFFGLDEIPAVNGGEDLVVD